MAEERKNRVPRLASWLLLTFIDDTLTEEFLGDLQEIFEDRMASKGEFSARIMYWVDALHLLFGFASLKIFNLPKPNIMFRHYFKISWRNLLRQKMFSTIKIGGFALGIAACLLILLSIKDELSYDQHYESGDRIYRLVNVDGDPAGGGKWIAFPAPTAQVLIDNFPEIEKAGRLVSHDWKNGGSNLFRREDQQKNIYETGFVYIDPDLIDILEISMVDGNSDHVLSKPNSIVLSQKMAEKYFPHENPVGKTIILNEDEASPFIVGGVMHNLPSTSHFQAEFLISLKGVEFWPGEQTSWCCFNYKTYIRVREGTDPGMLEDKLLYIRDQYMVPYLEKEGSTFADIRKKYHSFLLQPVAEIHLKSHGFEQEGDGDIRTVWLFGTIAICIILLACINFINLSTARSANRAVEVGLRKVVGSRRSDLIWQFLSESLLISLISFVLANLLAWGLLPFFNDLAGKSLTFPWTSWWLFPILGLLVLLIGIFAGIYPSLYLSAFQPIDVLKGNLRQGSKNSGLRNALVVFQFVTAMVLIICAMITYQQVEYILNKETGFDKEQIVMIHGINTLKEKQSIFKEELLRIPAVENATISDYLPISGTRRNQNTFWKEGRNKTDQGIDTQIWQVDSDYLRTMEMKLLEGRGFSSELKSDSSAIIINQTMARELGLENPVGERIMNWRSWQVIGVIEDFNFQSLRQNVGSLCLTQGNSADIISVKLRTEDIETSLNSITNVWDEFLPNQSIRYTFLDEAFAGMYENVRRLRNVFAVFVLLAIVVACLGLFALSAFMVEQKSKEISIRKVLGASTGSIFQMLTIDFLKWVFTALIIAIPIGWYVMSRWLEDYAYRIEISWEVFGISGAIVMLIAFLTISSESIKAASVDPARKLRSE